MNRRIEQPQRGKPGAGGGSGGPGGRFTRMQEKPKNVKETLKKLMVYILKSKELLLALFAIVIIVALANMVFPLLTAECIDAITISEEKLHVDFQALNKWLTVTAALAVILCALSYAQSLLVAYLSRRTIRSLRGDLFEKIAYLPIRYVDTHAHGDIMSRMTNDIENVSNAISQSLTSLFSGVITLVGVLTIMIIKSPVLTLVALSTMVLTVLFTTILSKYMRRYFPRQSKLLGELNAHSEEMITGYRTVMAYGRENQAQNIFDEIADDYKHTAIKAQISSGVMGPMMNVIGNISFLLVAGVGGALALKGAISIGIIAAFITYTKQFNRPINEIANQYASIQTALAGAERVFAIMDIPSEIDEGTLELEQEKVRGDLLFENINFSYVEGEQVLNNFNLAVKPGQKIAIVGATGSGKTTIVNLLTRFYDPNEGRILLDGVNINEISKESLRDTIAIVLQDTVIFSDTIEQNIRYGKLEATAEEIVYAAQTARVDSFADKLTEGYQTFLSESGGNLSQGQRQLISIARAVLADPKILILDEATSSIDTRTEMHIQEAMISLMKGRTSLIIAHRLSTIRDADNIIVIDHGHVVEMGDHEELLRQKGVYYKLYQSQFAGIET